MKQGTSFPWVPTASCLLPRHLHLHLHLLHLPLLLVLVSFPSFHHATVEPPRALRSSGHQNSPSKPIVKTYPPTPCPPCDTPPSTPISGYCESQESHHHLPAECPLDMKAVKELKAKLAPHIHEKLKAIMSMKIESVTETDHLIETLKLLDNSDSKLHEISKKAHERIKLLNDSLYDITEYIKLKGKEQR